MGLILSVLCSVLFCIERSLTWVICCVLLLAVMLATFFFAMYGITIGYHMAQKRMSARMEEHSAQGDVRLRVKRNVFGMLRSGNEIKEQGRVTRAIEEEDSDNEQVNLLARSVSSNLKTPEFVKEPSNPSTFPNPKLHEIVHGTISDYDVQDMAPHEAGLGLRKLLEFESPKSFIIYKKFPNTKKKYHR